MQKGPKGESVDYASLPLGEQYYDSLVTGFIDKDSHPEAPFIPRLVVNEPEESRDVLSVITKEMADCDSFTFSIAFVAESGITALIESLLRLQDKHIPGRILTSTYLSFNNPDALEKLSQFSNIELRVYEGPLHTKGYFFRKQSVHTLIIGSSNLTQSALLTNQEWNLLVHSYEKGSVCQSTLDEFERLWSAPETRAFSSAWLAEYREAFKARHPQPTYVSDDVAEAANEGEPNTEIVYKPIEYSVSSRQIVPNKMQADALSNLAKLRARGESKALLISATGTGKTYLAAFDVEAFKAKRALFAVHRERIASDAMKSFARVNGEGHTYGLYSGDKHNADADYVFCTIQLLAGHLDEFDPNEFDYVVIDEAHRAGAASYQKVIDYFRPRFLLGMTATPDRTDGYDIFKLFDNNIAYQITLQMAQENNMLAPFHYFGITDLNVDGSPIDDLSSFEQLTSEERVNHIVKEINNYTANPDRRGIVFCARNEEAKRLAEMFNARGFRCCALSGSSSPEDRASAIERLECDREKRDDYLEYVFTVDIFNEGIDIPSLNQIIMLRPTESAIIFVQQLGRGLRLHPGKEYVLVLDFIGNYQKSFLIPIALSGDRTYNKDNLRRYVKEGSRIIPGCSTIHFDPIAEERIYQSLDSTRFSTTQLIKKEYQSLKYMLGRIPTLKDFDDNSAMDPLIIFSNTSLGSYHAFLKKYEKDYTVHFSDLQERMIKFVSMKLAAGKRPQELCLLQELMSSSELAEKQYERQVRSYSERLPVAACSVANVLNCSFLTGPTADTFAGCEFTRYENGAFKITTQFADALKDPEFKTQMLELVDFGLDRYKKQYAKSYDGTNFVLYEKYTYEDVCRLLNWSKNINGLNIGGYKYDKDTNTFPVFINYEKGEDISASINYQDRFLSSSELIAISKQKRNLKSPEILRLKSASITGMRTYLFVRKNKNDEESSKEFYFLGGMEPTGDFQEITMAETNARAVEIRYLLETPVKDELFDYLTSESVG